MGFCKLRIDGVLGTLTYLLMLLMQWFRSYCWLPQKPICSYTLRDVSWGPPAIKGIVLWR